MTLPSCLLFLLSPLMSSLSPSSSSHRGNTLSEALVQQAFHHLLQDALIQAQREGLISKEEIVRHDTDIQIIASSLALYFAALTAKGNPPCITFPNDESLQLSYENCPPSFASFFHLWQASVARIQKLSLEYRHDLALLLCEREPISSPIRMQVASLARDLKSVALDIVQVCMPVICLSKDDSRYSIFDRGAPFRISSRQMFKQQSMRHSMVAIWRLQAHLLLDHHQDLSIQASTNLYPHLLYLLGTTLIGPFHLRHSLQLQ